MQKINLAWMAAMIAHYFPGFPMVSPCYNTANGHMPWTLFRFLAQQVDAIECRRMSLDNAATYNAFAITSGFINEADRSALQRNRTKWLEAGRLKGE